MKELLQQTYGSFFEDKLIDEIVETSLLRDFKEGDILIDFGDSIRKMPC
jgi:CRP/FNR family transcriptional regulator